MFHFFFLFQIDSFFIFLIISSYFWCDLLFVFFFSVHFPVFILIFFSHFLSFISFFLLYSLNFLCFYLFLLLRKTEVNRKYKPITACIFYSLLSSLKPFSNFFLSFSSIFLWPRQHWAHRPLLVRINAKNDWTSCFYMVT